jgi:zinc protease
MKPVLFLALAALLSSPAAAQYPTTPPPAAPVTPARFPPFQEAVLSNGIRLVLVENHAQPVLSISLTLPAGGVYDPAGKEGVASLTAQLLTKGAGSRNADEIAETIEGVGGTLTASAGRDFLTIDADVLSPQAELAFDLSSERSGTAPDPDALGPSAGTVAA